MGKGDGLSLISAGDPPRPCSALHIFQEAAKLFWWCRKPMLYISLVLLGPLALLFLGSYLVVTPITTDIAIKVFTISTKDPSSPEYHGLLTAAIKDLRELGGAEVASMLISFLSGSFFLMATVHTAAMASKREQATLQGLICRIRRTWKGPVATQLYVAIIYLGYTALWFILFVALGFISYGSVAVLVALGRAVGVFALLLLVYLEMVWSQGLVISVVEEGCYGLAALGKAAELVRGRRKLGFVVNLVIVVITVITSMVYSLVTTHLPPGKTGPLVCGLVAVYAGLLMSAFRLAVLVVFYYECKQSHGELEEAAMKGNLVYTRVPTAPILDGALP